MPFDVLHCNIMNVFSNWRLKSILHDYVLMLKLYRTYNDSYKTATTQPFHIFTLNNHMCADSNTQTRSHTEQGEQVNGTRMQQKDNQIYYETNTHTHIQCMNKENELIMKKMNFLFQPCVCICTKTNWNGRNANFKSKVAPRAYSLTK